MESDGEAGECGWLCIGRKASGTLLAVMEADVLWSNGSCVCVCLRLSLSGTPASVRVCLSANCHFLCVCVCVFELCYVCMKVMGIC